MDLSNEFIVDLPLDRAWAVLTDIERIAPCMPGAQLTGVDGATYSGTVSVKIGPVSAQYKGTASFERKDDAEHTAILRASGRDSRGQGNATALVNASLHGDGDKTHVVLRTDLTITGKVAQFGRGVILDVTSKLLDQFVQCLESSLVREAAETVAVGTSAPVEATNRTALQERPQPAPVEPLKLGAIVRGPVLKRVVPVVIGIAAIAGIIVWLGRR